MPRQFGRGLRVAFHILLGVAIVTLWFAPLAHFFPRRSRAHRARIVHGWMRRLLAMLSTRVRVSGSAAPGPALLVANHISWLDIPCLLGSVEAVFVAKGEVARWPLIGRLASAAGTIYLERGAGTAAAATRMITALRNGQRVMIFPEGTSTDGAAVRPFHARLYQAAIETGAPVQAVALRYPAPAGRPSRVPFIGDDNFAGHLWRLLAEPAIDAEVRFLSPCPSLSQTRRTLANQTRRQIAEALHIPLLYASAPVTAAPHASIASHPA